MVLRCLHPCHHHGGGDGGRKLEEGKSGQVVKEETICGGGREIFEGTFKKALAAPAVFISGPHPPPLPPNTLISYSQRPVWHDRPLTPQMAAL